jgi:ribonuclease J
MINLDKNKFYAVPLGGCNQIGMNLNTFGYNGQWIIADMGVSFYKKLGIDIIMPSMDFLKDKKVTAIFITHTHQDHLGAVISLAHSLNVPIFVPPFCGEVMKQQIDDIRLLNMIYDWNYQSDLTIKKGKYNVVVIQPGQDIHVGDFCVEFIRVAHSVPESNGLLISVTSGKKVIVSGDWRIDDFPVAGNKIDEERFREIGKKGGVDALFCDSTNAFEEESAESESVICENIEKLFHELPRQRIFFSCFSSNIARIKGCILAAKATNRKVYAVGRALDQNISAAKNLGYLDHEEIKVLENYYHIPHDNSIIICSGSQAEPSSTLSRLAFNPKSSLRQSDIIILSSRVIPGNEVELGKLKSMLAQKGARLIDSSFAKIHTSGHPSRADIRKLISWVCPSSFIPVHGDYHHLQANAELAYDFKIPAILTGNGALVEINGKKTQVVGSVPSGVLGKDGNRLINMNSSFLKDREKLGTDGVAIVSIDLLNKKIEVFTHGVTEDTVEIKELYEDIWNKELSHSLFEGKENKTNELLVSISKQSTNQFFSRIFKKDPEIIINLFTGEITDSSESISVGNYKANKDHQRKPFIKKQDFRTNNTLKNNNNNNQNKDIVTNINPNKNNDFIKKDNKKTFFQKNLNHNNNTNSSFFVTEDKVKEILIDKNLIDKTPTK